MYDIRQFKPALYSLLLLGFCGYGAAFGAPLMWIVAVGLTLLNAWLVRHYRFRPLPRLLAAALTIGALVFVVMHSELDPARLTESIAQFLVLLQLVKLFEVRANRDFGQLLVLSLLMMVAACTNTASLSFALILGIYLCLSLFCCLLFHLKVETDYAKAATGVAAGKSNPATLRQDERFLGRSMRRLTWLVASSALVFATVIFLFFPRGSGAGMFANVQFRSSQSLTGFNREVNFEQIAAIAQNDTVVADVRVWHGDAAVNGSEPLLLRGITLDVYGGAGSDEGPAWVWSRSAAVGRIWMDVDSDTQLKPAMPRAIRQEFTLQPTGTPVLFAVAGPCAIKPGDPDTRLKYSPVDEVLQLERPVAQQITYEVVSTGTLDEMRTIPPGAVREDRYRSMPRAIGDGADASGGDGPSDPSRRYGGPGRSRRDRSHSPALFVDEPPLSVIDPQITAYALRPDVSGSDEKGPLAARRDRKARTTELDAEIATNIEHHLRQAPFTYTLDLTDTQRPKDKDPLVYFLYESHRGHCEYFAGAMALLCQSLGLQARVVVGFRCDEFNPFIEAYIVRQSHAHAWVEVLDDQGHWRTFDPTSSRLGSGAVKEASFWTRMKQFIDFLDFTWARSVIAYDAESHANVVQAVSNRLATGRDDGMRAVERARQWIESIDVDAIATHAITPVLTLFIAGLVAAVAWYLIEQWMLRRRARRIGLEALPADERIRLARQLGFYDDLLRLLERHRVVRSPHLTPLEFSASVSYLAPGVFDAIRRLTLIFYRVRFGRRNLSPSRRRHLDNVIARIAVRLAGR